ncbi:MAG: hypothetical protein Q8L86_10255 [Vicinamibacterales bacterium]|nr:hypothetical protein [Vicinamibacterales bacterium]
MPCDYTIDPVDGILRLRATGACTYACWSATLTRATQDPAFTAGMPVFVDVREGTALPAPGKVERIARTWEVTFPRSRVALVALPGSAAYGIARQVGVHAKDRVAAFDDIAEAEAWLQPPRSGPDV